MKIWAVLGLFIVAVAASAQPAPVLLQTSIVEQIALWPGTAPGSENASTYEQIDGTIGDRSFSKIARPSLTVFFASNPNGAAVLVLPGGGYTKVVFDKEGVEIARWLNTLGIDAYVLKYRLPGEGHTPGRDVALQDAQRAIRLIRAGDVADSIGHRTNPKRVGVIGFSAGGNLAAILGAYSDSKVYEPVDGADSLSARPDFMMLGYPWVPLKNEIPNVSTPRAAFAAAYIFADKVSADTPPAFVFAGNRDDKVPYLQSERVTRDLQSVGVPAELHIFPGASHGFALRGKGEEKAWPALCATWLEKLGIIPAAK